MSDGPDHCCATTTVERVVLLTRVDGVLLLCGYDLVWVLLGPGTMAGYSTCCKDAIASYSANFMRRVHHHV
jgi:hypothetical protein